MRKLFVFLFQISMGLMLLQSLGCVQQDVTAIKQSIHVFYKSAVPYYQVDSTVVTSELLQLIKRARLLELTDAERVKKSAYPTDKPLMIEGDIYTSIYEGHDSLQIEKIDIKDKQANVLVQFFNSGYHLQWKNIIQLKNEQGWKLDNIVFDSLASEKNSTRKILSEFIHLGQ